MRKNLLNHQNFKKQLKTRCIFLILFVLLVLNTGCGQTQTPAAAPAEPDTETLEPDEVGSEPEVQPEVPLEPLPPENSEDVPIFGYGDLKGVYALALSDPNTIHPEIYTQLSLSGGRLVKITYGGIQPPGAKDNAMDISSNFEQRYGAVYKLASGSIPENESVTLMTDTFVSQRNFYSLIGIGTASEDRTIQNLVEADKKLPLKNFWQLYDVEGGSKIWLAQFEPENGRALASVILEHKGQRWYADFPAQYFKELDLYSWRVDDGGEIDPESFIVGWFAEREEIPELALYWRGVEGASLYWLKGRNGQFLKYNEAFRYWGAY